MVSTEQRAQLDAAGSRVTAASKALNECPIEDRARLRELFKDVESAAEAMGSLLTGGYGMLYTEMLCAKVLLILRLRDINALRARVDALEAQQKAVRYRGVYQPAETYAKGNLATYDGSLWACIADDPGKPGVSGWQLAVKKGRDGADAREHA